MSVEITDNPCKSYTVIIALGHNMYTNKFETKMTFKYVHIFPPPLF